VRLATTARVNTRPVAPERGEVSGALAYAAQAALPGVTITVLPGSGHFPRLPHPAELAKTTKPLAPARRRGAPERPPFPGVRGGEIH
jgi:hypothetical protein